MVHIFITKEKEKVLGIQEQVKKSWRRQDNIPDSDGFEVYLQGPQETQYLQLNLAIIIEKDKLGAYKSR